MRVDARTAIAHFFSPCKRSREVIKKTSQAGRLKAIKGRLKGTERKPDNGRNGGRKGRNERTTEEEY